MKTKINPQIAIILFSLIFIIFVVLLLKASNQGPLATPTQTMSDSFYFKDVIYNFEFNFPSSFQSTIRSEGEPPFTFYNVDFIVDSKEFTVTVTSPEMEGIIKHSLNIDLEEDLSLKGFTGSKIISVSDNGEPPKIILLLHDSDNLYYLSSSDLNAEPYMLGIYK